MRNRVCEGRTGSGEGHIGMVLVLDVIVEGMEAINGTEQEQYMGTINTSTVWEIEQTAV